MANTGAHPLAGFENAVIHRLDSRPDADLAALPMTVKVLLEGLLRAAAAGRVTEADVAALARWPEPPPPGAELPFTPARVLLQDFTGVPAVVDLAAMRSAMERAGKDAGRIDPLVPADLVIDHSVQVDVFGSVRAYDSNIVREYERNHERYALLRWAQQAFNSFSVVPPGMGICHQVNLEYLAKVVQVRDEGGVRLLIPDTLVGTDSHTTMVNGLGVLGWGVGGIEAEAALLGQPMFLTRPGRRRRQVPRRPAPGRNRDRPRADGDRDAPQARRRQQVRRVLRQRASQASRCPTGRR